MARKFLKSRSVLVMFLLMLAATGLVSFSKVEPGQFHSKDELAALRASLRNLPTGVNTYFSGSGLCNGCHGHDPNNFALLNANGVDVNIADDWAGTMMANSAKDPMWRAKLSHEILVNPAHQDEIENTCTRCHAPLGKFDALYSGITDYNIADMINDSVALDGVSCSACHQIKDTLIGKLFSGQMHYDTTHTIYGPYTNPFNGPMQSFIGFDPVYSDHVNRAGLCAGCHTLITQSLDLSGNPTGNSFVEQATYHEWLNSFYNNEEDTIGITCQGCHIPRINDKVVISANYSFLDGRKPFGMHHLVGANSFMLNIFKNNMASIGITCQSKNIDSAIVRTNRMMQDSAVVLDLTETNRTVDTVFYDLKLTNNAGHKFPSGYPSRKAWIEFVVMNDNGDTLFKSGLQDANHAIIGEDPVFEPHYNMIKDEQQVQIYEMVMGDVNLNYTTVLERADVTLKDNRLVPLGFTTTHNTYDTTKIIGAATTDPDFNLNGAVQGTGADIVHWHIPLNGYTGGLNVTAKLYYLSIPHRFVQDMFTFSSPEIGFFQTLFNGADHTPLLVAMIKDGAMFSGVSTSDQPSLRMYPNPTHDQRIRVEGLNKEANISLFTVGGQKAPFRREDEIIILPRQGVFIIRIEMSGKIYTQRVIAL